jgi:hypothetical protein
MLANGCIFILLAPEMGIHIVFSPALSIVMQWAVLLK